MERVTARPRSMLPREHGAYAQFGLPLVAALAASHPTVSSACYALAACAVFLSHEPALVLLGHRGLRARRESAAKARRWLAASLLTATVLGGAALVLSPAARPWIALPAGLAAALGIMVVRRQERSLVGEILACAALVSAAVPAAIAGAIHWQDALASCAVFLTAFLVTTVEVRSVARHPVGSFARVVIWAGALAAMAALAATRPLLGLAPLPVVLVIGYVVVRAPSPTALRRIGWTLATCSLLMTVAVAIAVRAAQPALSSPRGLESAGASTTE